MNKRIVSILMIVCMVSGFMIFSPIMANAELYYDSYSDVLVLPTDEEVKARNPQITLNVEKAESKDDVIAAGVASKHAGNYFKAEYDTYIVTMTATNIGDLAVGYADDSYETQVGLCVPAVWLSLKCDTEKIVKYTMGYSTFRDPGACGINGDSLNVTFGSATNVGFSYPTFDDWNGMRVTNPTMEGKLIICLNSGDGVRIKPEDATVLYVLIRPRGPYPVFKKHDLNTITLGKIPYNSENIVQSRKQQKILNNLNIDPNTLLQNISCGNHPIKGPSVTFLGQTFYLFEFDASLNLDLAGTPVSVTVDPDSKTIKFLIGFEDFNGNANLGSAGNSTNYWSESYKEVKSLYQDITGKKVDTTRLWNRFSSLRGKLRGKLKKVNANMIVNADCYVAGYMELSYETGDVKFSEGGLVMEAGINEEIGGRLPFPFSVCYWTVGLGASVDGTFKIAYDDYISLCSQLNAELAAKVIVGGGEKKFLKTYVEGGLIGTVGADMYFGSGQFSSQSQNPLTLYLKGDLYLSGAVLGFGGDEKKWEIGKVQLYPRNEISLMSLDLADSQGIDDGMELKPLSREYLYSPMLLSVGGEDKIYSDTAIYSYNAPRIETLPDGRLLLLWIDDLGTKNDVNKTSLMYSIYDGEFWSEATQIYETGTYNGAPVVYNDGTGIHVLWNRAKTVFCDDAGFEDLVKDTELYYTYYNGNEFSEPVMITDNSRLETSCDIVSDNGKICALWTENSENNLFLAEGTNYIYMKEYKNSAWQEAKLVTQSEETVGDMKGYYEDGEPKCAYVLVNDNNEGTMYLDSTQIPKGNYINYEDGKIYYIKDNEISIYDTNTKQTLKTGISGVQNINIKNGNIYTVISGDLTCELYENILEDGVYSGFEQVTEFDKYIRNYSVATDKNGEPIYALNLVDVNLDEERVYGASELVVCKATDINALKVSAVYYDETNVAPSAELPLNIDITNTGTTDINSLNVSIIDSEGVEVSSGTVSTAIADGESATIVYNYNIPSELTLHDITVMVKSSDDERNLDDNSVSTSIGYADILVQNMTVERTENGAKATGSIYNAGYADAEKVILSIYDSSYPDEVLATVECSDIAPGEKYEIAYDIPEKYLTIEDKMTMYGLTFKAESDSAESSYANNSEKVVFGELTDYTVTFVDGNELLDIVSVDEFDSYTYTKKGYTLEGWYTSSELDENSKITFMPEDISENLIVFAKWIPMSIDSTKYLNKCIDIKATISEELLSEDGVIIIALYKNGKLVTVHYEDIAPEIQKSFENIDDIEGCSVKIFCWRDINNMLPICEEVETIVHNT